MSEPDEDDWYGDSFWESVAEDSRQRRENPLDFVKVVLNELWFHSNSEAEALALWRTKVEQFPWYAEDALATLGAVIANPPDDLADIIRHEANVRLNPVQAEDSTQLGAHDYLEWLASMTARLQLVFNEVVHTRRVDHSE